MQITDSLSDKDGIILAHTSEDNADIVAWLQNKDSGFLRIEYSPNSDKLRVDPLDITLDTVLREIELSYLGWYLVSDSYKKLFTNDDFQIIGV